MTGPRTVATVIVVWLMVCVIGFAVASCQEQDDRPPMPIEAWARPKPPGPPPVIADSYWQCSHGLTDDARARLRQKCRDDGGSPGPEWRAFYCYAQDWKGTVLWKIDALDVPPDRSARGGYVEVANRSFVVLP